MPRPKKPKQLLTTATIRRYEIAETVETRGTIQNPACAACAAGRNGGLCVRWLAAASPSLKCGSCVTASVKCSLAPEGRAAAAVVRRGLREAEAGGVERSLHGVECEQQEHRDVGDRGLNRDDVQPPRGAGVDVAAADDDGKEISRPAEYDDAHTAPDVPAALRARSYNRDPPARHLLPTSTPANSKPPLQPPCTSSTAYISPQNHTHPQQSTAPINTGTGKRPHSAHDAPPAPKRRLQGNAYRTHLADELDTHGAAVGVPCGMWGGSAARGGKGAGRCSGMRGRGGGGDGGDGEQAAGCWLGGVAAGGEKGHYDDAENDAETPDTVDGGVRKVDTHTALHQSAVPAKTVLPAHFQHGRENHDHSAVSPPLRARSPVPENTPTYPTIYLRGHSPNRSSPQEQHAHSPGVHKLGRGHTNMPEHDNAGVPGAGEQAEEQLQDTLWRVRRELTMLKAQNGELVERWHSVNAGAGVEEWSEAGVEDGWSFGAGGV